jgi:pimeloyl-ACP methyl ester carboxylesterase
MEYPSFITNNNGRDLYSVLHLPERPQDLGFVYCAPLFSEHIKSYRVGVTFARRLAAQGYPVLRFDYMGDGDSEGDFEDADVESRIADIGSVVRHFRTVSGVQHVGLWGLRMGATLAACAAPRLCEVEALLLWEPIMRVREHFFEFLRANLSNQLVVHRKVLYNRERLIENMLAGEIVNIDGWRMTGRLWEQGAALDPAADLAHSTLPVLSIVLGDDRPDGLPERDNLRCAQLPREFSWSLWDYYNPFPEKLFAASLAWIEQRGTNGRN